MAQKRITGLQQSVIDQKNREISSVKETVKHEIKSYASVVEKTCATAALPKQMKLAVNNASAADTKDRNLAEEQGESGWSSSCEP